MINGEYPLAYRHAYYQLLQKLLIAIAIGLTPIVSFKITNPLKRNSLNIFITTLYLLSFEFISLSLRIYWCKFRGFYSLINDLWIEQSLFTGCIIGILVIKNSSKLNFTDKNRLDSL